MFWLLLAVYIGLMAVGVIWSISLAWRSGVLWGIGSLILWIPIYFPCYVIYNYREAWKPLIVVGMAMMIGYSYIAPQLDIDRVAENVSAVAGSRMAGSSGHPGLDTERAMREADAAMLRDGGQATGVYVDRRRALDRAMAEGAGTGDVDDLEEVPVYAPDAIGTGYTAEERALAGLTPEKEREIARKKALEAQRVPTYEKTEITVDEFPNHIGARMEVTNTHGRTFDVILKRFDNDLAVFRKRVGQGGYEIKIHRRKIRKAYAWVEVSQPEEEVASDQP